MVSHQRSTAPKQHLAQLWLRRRWNFPKLRHLFSHKPRDYDHDHSNVEFGASIKFFSWTTKHMVNSMDWLKVKSTGNHCFYHQIWWAFRLKISHHPILCQFADSLFPMGFSGFSLCIFVQYMVNSYKNHMHIIPWKSMEYIVLWSASPYIVDS